MTARARLRRRPRAQKHGAKTGRPRPPTPGLDLSGREPPPNTSVCLCASTRTRGPAPRGFTGFLDHVYSTLAPAPGPSLHKGRRKSGESARRSRPSLKSESEQQSLGGRRRRVTHPSGPEARSGAWITCLAGDCQRRAEGRQFMAPYLLTSRTSKQNPDLRAVASRNTAPCPGGPACPS